MTSEQSPAEAQNLCFRYCCLCYTCMKWMIAFLFSLVNGHALAIWNNQLPITFVAASQISLPVMLNLANSILLTSHISLLHLVLYSLAQLLPQTYLGQTGLEWITTSTMNASKAPIPSPANVLKGSFVIRLNFIKMFHLQSCQVMYSKKTKKVACHSFRKLGIINSSFKTELHIADL